MACRPAQLRSHWLATLALAGGLLAAGFSADASAVPAPAATEQLTATFSNDGLVALQGDGLDLLADGGVQLSDLKLNNAGVTGPEWSPTHSAFDAGRRVQAVAFTWGSIKVAYLPHGNQLDLDLTVSNTGPKTITRFGVTLLQLRLPSTLQGMLGHHDMVLHNRSDDFPIVGADWPDGHLALCGLDATSTASFGLQPGNPNAYLVTVRNEDQPIKPGATLHVPLSIRIGGTDSGVSALSADVLANFAKAYPSELNWPDRRPIGSAFLSTSNAGYAKNPRGWLMQPDMDTTTPAGRAMFKTKMLAYADDCVRHCKDLDAQGVIVWDIEGQEMPHATSYVADPAMLPKVAPEMEPVADEFFRKFTDAHLRTGVTIRPTHVVPAADGHGWSQKDVPDPVGEMDEKMTYAHKRWGCTLFYLDSNVVFLRDPNGQVIGDPAMPAAAFRTLAEHHKDCLLMPEHKTSQYWAYTAPYSEFRLGFKGTDANTLATYPHAFSVMQVVDGQPLSDPDSVKTLTAAIHNGDVLLFRPWWDDPQTADIKHLYEAAAKPQGIPAAN